MPTVSHVYQTAGTYTARVTVTDNLGCNSDGHDRDHYFQSAFAARKRSSVIRLAGAGSSRALECGERCDRGWLVRRFSNPDAGAAKLTTPSAQPVDYFEMSFYAVSGRAYRLWMRGKAQNDSPYNDSVFVQFSGSVDASGMPAFLIGTPDATTDESRGLFGLRPASLGLARQRMGCWSHGSCCLLLGHRSPDATCASSRRRLVDRSNRVVATVVPDERTGIC